MKIAFYDTHNYEKSAFLQANKNFEYMIDFLDFKLSEKTVEAANGSDAVCIFVNDVANREVLWRLADMGIQLIVLRCSGYNNVDLEEAERCGINVMRVPSYSPHAIAEHTVGILLSLLRKIPQAYVRTRGGNFSLEGLTGRTLYGKNVGIIGTGKIGQIVADILNGFGMNILLYDIQPDYKWASVNGYTYVNLKDLFIKSDVISLHCPLTTETKHIINVGSLSLMKQNCVLLNTSRGALIDTTALINALKSKRIAGAGLDVYEEESKYFFSDWSEDIISDDVLSRILTFPNVIVTGHQAFLTEDALAAIATTTLENVRQFDNGETLENLIWIA